MSHYTLVAAILSHYTSVAAILCLIIHRWQPFYVSLYIGGSHFMSHYTLVAAILSHYTSVAAILSHYMLTSY